MKKRLIAVFCAFCVMVSLLYVRLSALSTSKELAQAAQKQSSKTLTVSTVRGQIYDRRYQPLVNRETVYRASVLPQPENFDAVLGAVDASRREDVLKLLQQGDPFVIEVNKALLGVPGVQTFQVPQRYQDNQTAAHIVGYLNGDGAGASGIEAAYDDLLTENAVSATISYTLDGMGRELAGAQPTVTNPPAGTGGVVLTIDRDLQQIVEKAGSQLKRGAILMLEPATGKIRAAASFPAFSPNNLAKSIKDEENAPMINRAFCAYSVGSTFKISTAAAALEQGVSRSLRYTCTGVIDVKGQKFKCHKLAGHGTLDMAGAMEESCNPYFINLALGLDKERLVAQASDLSFGKSYDLAPGMRTQPGYLPTQSELFNPADVANFSFGQGKLTATPLQVGLMMCSVLNGGRTPRASLVEGETTDGKTLSHAQEDSATLQAMSAQTASTIKQFLVDAVMVRENQNAKPDTVSAGGKTGTAQTGRFVDGVEMVQAWFAGFFPADQPKYVVVVLVEDGDFGNTSASPIFRQIADEVTALEKNRS